jgi:TonB-dependent SusC/RagA subfamily outer membrane receptor
VGSATYNPSGSTELKSSNIRIGQPSYSFEPKVTIEAENGNPDTTPLYIIKSKDGEIEKTDLKDINPNDIESINVLKGSTATFQYGEKGKNGVIIITLKKNSKYYLQKK